MLAAWRAVVETEMLEPTLGTGDAGLQLGHVKVAVDEEILLNELSEGAFGRLAIDEEEMLEEYLEESDMDLPTSGSAFAEEGILESFKIVDDEVTTNVVVV